MEIQSYSQQFSRPEIAGEVVNEHSPAPQELNDFVSQLPSQYPGIDTEEGGRILPPIFLGAIGGHWVWIVLYIVITN